MTDYSELSTWGPAFLAVGVVGIVLGGVALMAYSVANRLALLDQRINDQQSTPKRRPTKKEQQRAADEAGERQARIRSYRRTGGWLITAAVAITALNLGIAALTLLPMWPALAAVLALTVGGLLLARAVLHQPTRSDSDSVEEG